jgi:predicted transcriptional regulator
MASQYDGSITTATEAPMTKTKVTTIRQPADQADELEFIARVDGVPMSEAIREAVADYIQVRRADPAFQQRLRERIDADRNILKRLAE